MRLIPEIPSPHFYSKYMFALCTKFKPQTGHVLSRLLNWLLIPLPMRLIHAAINDHVQININMESDSTIFTIGAFSSPISTMRTT